LSAGSITEENKAMPMMWMPFMGADFFGLLTTIFLVWMLIDCIFNKNIRGGSKVFWFFVIVFLNWFGALFYFFSECKHRNPFDALAYYYQTITGTMKSNSSAHPYSSQPPRAQQSQAPLSTAYPTYSDYAQGYQPQAQAPLSSSQSADATYYQPESQAEYEQPTISYPEMPQQQ
jgi:hypothetical protein